MSHAEYAPKRLPVLKRLAMALRQIPAVEFALSRFKTLLRGRTNEEPPVTSTLLPPASDVANEGATDAIASQPVESATATGGSVEAEAPLLDLSGNEAVEIDAGETAAVEAEACTSDAGEIAPDAADSIAADAPTPVVASTELTEPHAEPVVAADADASDTVEIDVGETPPLEIVAIADEIDETIVVVDQVAPVATASDDLPEEEMPAGEKAMPAAADEIEIEIEAVEAPCITAEPVGIETAEPCTSDAGEIAPDVPDSIAADDPTPIVASTELTEPHAEPVVMPDAVASDAAEIDVGEATPVEIVAIADDTDEMIVEADEKAAPAAAEEIEIEIEAVEAPCITAEPIGIEAAEPCAIDAIEAPSLGAEDIAAPEATSVDRIEEEPEPVAVTPDVAVPDALSEREALIRRRWNETGIMMWRGVGQSTLCIQGSTALLPPKPGETMPQYDRLEFRLIDGLIVCEGFVVEAAPLKNRPLARAA